MARARHVIKRLLGALAVAAAVQGATAVAVRAQAPNEDWRTLETEHFRVTFPAELETMGRRAADRAETAYRGLAEVFKQPPESTIDILLTDHIDVSNGYAQVIPSNRITIFARPPMDGPSLGFFDDWLELVITHELAHVVHLDYTTSLVGKVARGVFGRATGSWPFFPELSTPRWVIEGLAVWYESDLTSAGRVRGTFDETELRTAILEGRFENIGQASGQSPLWPGGNRPYVYGSLFFDYVLRRYGEDRMRSFVDAVAGQWVPYRLDAAGRSAFGVSLSDAWADWTDELTRRYAQLDQKLSKLGPISEPERLTRGARWGLHPTVSPDGSALVYDRSDARSDSQLRVQEPPGGASREVGRTNGLATFGWMPDGRILISQLEYTDPYHAYSDLYVMDLDGHSERLTHGARLDEPSVAPDGLWAVAVQEGSGTNGLVRVDVASGTVSPLVPAVPDVHWSFPRVSPDGRWIAATRWEPEAYMDVVILDARTGALVSRVTQDRAIDLAPAWSPDSRWVVWSSDRTGIMNILGAEVDPASGRADAPVLLTNVRTGVDYPSVDPTGHWLYVSGYHVDGWEVERVPFDPEAYGRAPAPDARFAPPPGPPPQRGEAGGPLKQYSALPTLLPTYWQLRYRESVSVGPVLSGGVSLPRRELLGFGLGAETSGIDLVGRHAWAAYAQAFTSGGKWEGGAAYSYRGLGNPVFAVSVDQTWSGGGQFVAGSAPDTVYVLARERALDGSMTLASTRWRRDLTLTLGGGLVWRHRDLVGSNLEPTTQYALTHPTSRLGEMRVALGVTTARTYTFQMGPAHGLTAFVQGTARRELGLAASDAGVIGVDQSYDELAARVREYVPLWGGGFATHVLALQASAGWAGGPGAELGHFGVGGATGEPQTLSGFDLFGGSYVFLPVRGFPRATLYGRYAWAGTAEYRFPIALLNRGVGVWPLHFDRILGSLFVDAGNAWEPNPRGPALVSTGAEATLQVLDFYDSSLLLRAGVAVLVQGGTGSLAYLRAGLPF